MKFEPIIDTIDWNKRIGKIWADDTCNWSVNSPWYHCLYLKIKLLPDFGYLKKEYDFQETDKVHDYPHILKILKTPERPKKGSFQIHTIHDNIQSIEFLGIESFDFTENLRIIALNEFLMKTDTFQFLVIPDWTSGNVMFTFDNNTIKKFIENDWRRNLGSSEIELKRIKKTEHIIS